MAGGLAPQNPANEPDKKPVKHHSRFKPSMSHYYGATFGDLHLSYASQTVPGDENFTIRCNSDIDTFSLKAPLMSPIKHRKAYFYVPKKAILPKNSDLYVTNPMRGEDIVPEMVNTVTPFGILFSCLYRFLNGANTIYRNNHGSGDKIYSVENVIATILRQYQIGMMFLSSGSLLHRAGCSTYDFYRGPFDTLKGRYLTFDESMDYLIGWIRKYFKSFNVAIATLDTISPIPGGGSENYTPVAKVRNYLVDLDYESPGYIPSSSQISIRQLLFLLREGYLDRVVANSATLRDEYTLDDVEFIPDIENGEGVYDYFVQNPISTASVFQDENPGDYLNVERLVAYQLACAQWYSNDAVDAVYTTGLWHQTMTALAKACAAMGASFAPTIQSETSVDTNAYMAGVPSYNRMYSGSYLLNGLSQEYDSVSGKMLTLCILSCFSPFSSLTPNASLTNFGNVTTSSVYDMRILCGFFYCQNLFNEQRALRYKDYFVGARTQPLAVGDVNVEVNDSKVNVIDISKNIMMQRFLNQVNRIHRTLKEYSRGIFDQAPMFDPREVMFIGSTEEVIGAEETENTGADQLTKEQTITSHLRSQSSRFAFSFDSPEFGVIIGITSFDTVRPYVSVTDREMFHVDRFDDFNPYMQHIGDQGVVINEIAMYRGGEENFGYQLRYAEYKQKTDRASGPFVGDYLPGYALVATPGMLMSPGDNSVKLDSDFIRCRSYEFDQFYVALTNFSLAGYFHFIVRDDYDVSANRPMEAAPSIL